MCRYNQQGGDLPGKRQPTDSDHQFEPRVDSEVVVNADVVARIGVEVIATHQMQHIAEKPE